MENPNAVAALVSSQAAVAVEQLGETYLNAHIGPFWSKEIIAAVTITVLYVGRHGIKAALVKVWATAKNLWSPSSTTDNPGTPPVDVGGISAVPPPAA